MNAVAPSPGADVQNRITHTGRFTKEDLISAHQAGRECVDEWIQGVTIIEGHLPANRRDAESVTVMCNAGDDPGEQRSITAPVLRMIDRSKSQTVQRGDRAGAHGEDVAQNSAHSRGGSLKRLDKRRMIMGFDLEGGAPTITNVHDPGVFTRRYDDALTFGWQTLQMDARRLIRTVLGPHH